MVRLSALTAAVAAAECSRAHRTSPHVTPTFELVVREHGPLIRRIARSYEANRALVEEVVQEIHVALWEALPRFRGDAELRTFVVKVAHNRAISHVAKEARRPRSVELDEALPDPATWLYLSVHPAYQTQASIAASICLVAAAADAPSERRSSSTNCSRRPSSISAMRYSTCPRL